MAASLEALAELQTDSTHGLCADFMAFDAAAGRYRAVTTQVLERPGDGTFSWNACRCARGPTFPTLIPNLFQQAGVSASAGWCKRLVCYVSDEEQVHFWSSHLELASVSEAHTIV